MALEFLDELARRLLGGDRSRVVITNGNHDVDWNTALAAMTRVERADEPANVADQLRRVDTLYRWCWRTRQIYRIANPGLYERRLEAFWDFHSRFYDGVPNLLRVRRGAEVNLFELFDKRVAVACFNSCHNNDCFAFHGAIAPPAISRACLDLDDSGPYDLRIAVWHHGLDGPPYQTDYMDSELVRSMIGRGFRLRPARASASFERDSLFDPVAQPRNDGSCQCWISLRGQARSTDRSSSTVQHPGDSTRFSICSGPCSRDDCRNELRPQPSRHLRWAELC